MWVIPNESNKFSHLPSYALRPPFNEIPTRILVHSSAKYFTFKVRFVTIICIFIQVLVGQPNKNYTPTSCIYSKQLRTSNPHRLQYPCTYSQSSPSPTLAPPPPSPSPSFVQLILRHTSPPSRPHDLQFLILSPPLSFILCPSCNFGKACSRRVFVEHFTAVAAFYFWPINYGADCCSRWTCCCCNWGSGWRSRCWTFSRCSCGLERGQTSHYSTPTCIPMT